MDRRIDPGTLTVGQLAQLYSAHARTYYRRADGTPTGEHVNIAAALKHLVDVAGADTEACMVDRYHLRDLQDLLVAKKRTRTYINGVLAKIRRAYLWLVQEHNADEGLLGMFLRVPPLRAGRSPAAEPRPVGAADLAAVRATMPYLSPALRDLMELATYTGARIGELACLRACDVWEQDGSWWACPKWHKTSYQGQRRIIALSPRALAVVRRRMDRVGVLFGDAYLFPSAVGARRAYYSTRSISAAIKRARERAAKVGLVIPHWHPHQLRHLAATTARRAGASLDDVQALLGHRSRRMTEHYAALDVPAGAKRAAELVAASLAEGTVL